MSDTKKEQRIIQQAPMYLQVSFRKNTFLIQVEEAPGISLPHLTPILLPWKLPLLSAGCISSPGFLYNFNTYASISHNLGFSFACLKFILLLVSYYMYYLVTFLFFFLFNRIIKFHPCGYVVAVVYSLFHMNLLKC